MRNRTVGWLLTRHNNLENIARMLREEYEMLDRADVCKGILDMVGSAEGCVSVATLRMRNIQLGEGDELV